MIPEQISIKPLASREREHFIYLFEREKEGERERAQEQGEEKADSPLSREPAVQLNPRTLGS